MSVVVQEETWTTYTTGRWRSAQPNLTNMPRHCRYCEGTGWRRWYTGHGDFDEEECTFCKGSGRENQQ